MWISAIRAVPLSDAEAEIRNVLAERHVDQKAPEPVRGNEVIHVFERADGQAGLPETATIITVGQGYVAPGSVVAAIPERDVETAVAIKDNEETD